MPMYKFGSPAEGELAHFTERALNLLHNAATADEIANVLGLVMILYAGVKASRPRASSKAEMQLWKAAFDDVNNLKKFGLDRLNQELVVLESIGGQS